MTKDEAIELLDCLLGMVDDNQGNDYDEAFHMAIDALKKQQEPQWIPCERELPDDYTDVLAWFEYFRYGDYNCLYQTYGIGSYSMKYDLWMINHETGWKKLRVIAWMPLPEPWRGEERG